MITISTVRLSLAPTNIYMSNTTIPYWPTPLELLLSDPQTIPRGHVIFST